MVAVHGILSLKYMTAMTMAHFFVNTVFPPGADNNPDMQLRFRSTGHHKSDYCWGDDVTVVGIYDDGVIPEPDIAVSGTGVFGIVVVGTSDNQNITISNIGDADLIIDNLNGLASPFLIDSDDCSFATLAPTESCVISVSFTPGSAGPFADSLNIPSDDTDEANASFAVSGTGTDVPGQEVVIVEADFETGSTSGWILTGNVVIDGILANNSNYSLRHTKASSSLLHVSTTGYSGVSITMHIAATSLDNGEGCFAEVSTDSGDSWVTVAEILNGDDDGIFISGTESPPDANGNPDLQLRFRSTGGKKPDYCYGDDVTVLGTLD
jgi:hypothetical protein